MRFKKYIRAGLRALPVLLALAPAAGCALQSYNMEARSFYRDYREGRAARAAAKVSKKAKKKANGRDRLLWRLEQGTVLLSAADFEASLRAFEAAEAVLRDYDERAVVTGRGLAREGAALMTNTTAIPYYGRGYDKIMLNTYKALAYARQGKLEDARVELRRAYERQKQAVEKHGKAIERAQARARREQADPDKAMANPRVRRQMAEHYGNLDAMRAYAEYVNPFTVYLDGLLSLAAGGNSDLERAKKNFERTLGMVGAKDLLAADLESVEKRYGTGRVPPTVYVVIENGMAPVRREISFFLPIIAPVPRKGGRVKVYGQFVSASFPRLEFQPAPYRHFDLRAGGESLGRTQLLCSMDAVIGREFKHELPIIFARTLAATTARALARYRAAKEEGIWADFGMLLYDVAVARADLRTWLTLPKEFQFARFPAPARKLDIFADNGQKIVTLDLPQAQMTLVYVKTPSRGVVSVQVIKLR